MRAKNFDEAIIQKSLRSHRKENGKTQQNIADALSVTIKTVNQWEKGKKGFVVLPDIESLWKLANYYNVSIDYLVGRSDFTNIGNEEISEITDLSNDSIETLRALSESDHIDSKITINCINLLLEYSEFINTDLEIKDLSSVTNIFIAFFWYIQHKTEPETDDEFFKGIEYMDIRTIHNRLDEIANKYNNTPEFQNQIKNIKELITKRQNVIAKKKESRE